MGEISWDGRKMWAKNRNPEFDPATLIFGLLRSSILSKALDAFRDLLFVPGLDTCRRVDRSASNRAPRSRALPSDPHSSPAPSRHGRRASQAVEQRNTRKPANTRYIEGLRYAWFGFVRFVHAGRSVLIEGCMWRRSVIIAPGSFTGSAPAALTGPRVRGSRSWATLVARVIQRS